MLVARPASGRGASHEQGDDDHGGKHAQGDGTPDDARSGRLRSGEGEPSHGHDEDGHEHGAQHVGRHRPPMVTGRALAALAALLMMGTAVLAVAPVSSDVSAGGEPGPRLSCGSLFFPSEVSFTDACEDARVPRIMATLVVWTAGLVLGTVGLGVLYRAVRHL